MTGTEAVTTLGIVVAAVSPFALALWRANAGRFRRIEDQLDEISRNGFNPAVCREVVGGLRSDLGQLETRLGQLTNGGQLATLRDRLTRLETLHEAGKQPPDR